MSKFNDFMNEYPDPQWTEDMHDFEGGLHNVIYRKFTPNLTSAEISTYDTNPLTSPYFDDKHTTTMLKLISGFATTLVYNLTQNQKRDRPNDNEVMSACMNTLIVDTYLHFIQEGNKEALNDRDDIIHEAQMILHSIADLLVKKNHDYGSSFFDVAKTLGLVQSFSVRFLDKANRLKEFVYLIDHNQQSLVSDESVTDTIRDLLGYYLLYLVAWDKMNRVTD